MNSSFSFRRFGVISRIRSPRCSVWCGGSNDGSWSLNGNAPRCSSMMALMSSPSSGTGHGKNGPATVLQLENRSASR